MGTLLIGYDRAALLGELTRDEGNRMSWYRCTAGKRSIGRGRNLDDVGISAAETATLGITVATCIARGITEPISRALFWDDVARSEADLDRRFPWWRGLDPVRQRVLLNMCFNMGGARLAGFTDMLAAARAGRFAVAAAEMADSAWHGQVGARATRLEAMMRTGRAA